MNLQNAPVSQLPSTHYSSDLPHVVENDLKKCALPEERVESEWKVSSPSLELTAPNFSKTLCDIFQNPPINFPPRKM